MGGGFYADPGLSRVNSNAIAISITIAILALSTGSIALPLRSYISKAFCFGPEMESRSVGALWGQCLTGKKILLQNYQDCL